MIEGDGGVSVASGLNYYLQKYARKTISWEANNLKLPKKLIIPPDESKERIMKHV